jgi:hypothetical protein
MNSCADEALTEPHFYYIDAFTLKTASDNSEGTQEQKITDGWVYKNGDLLGVFELPVTVPILGVDTNNITVIPGIIRNGRSNDRITFPFFTPFDSIRVLKPNSYDTLRPVTEYRAATKFLWLEDFEDRSISLVTENPDASVDSLVLVDDSIEVVNYGPTSRVSAKVVIPPGGQSFEIRSIGSFEVTRNQPVFLEFDYKTDVDLQVGIFAVENGVIRASIPVLILFEKDEWNKVYISLAEDMNSNDYAGMDFRIFFSSITNKTDESYFYIDNIKLLGF